MKRLFSLVLAICMLLSAAAFAEQDKVIQDEQPPKIATYVNADGKTIVAKVCDADGNVLAEIADDGSLILMDVHFREEKANQRLIDAYEGIMKGVHYSDVDCKIHDHNNLKVDINEILENLAMDITAHDLVMYELYDVIASEDVTSMLTENGYIEVTFELTEDQAAPLITMFSPDGIVWQVLPTEASDNGFTVKLVEPGSMALLAVNEGIGQKVEHTYVPNEHELSSETVNNFTPSVTGKPAPEVVTFEGDDMTYAGTIVTTEGIIYVPDMDYIQVTAYVESDYVIDIQTHEHLEWAFGNILGVENVGELYTEHTDELTDGQEHVTIADLIDKNLADMGYEVTHDQLVVKDLFEVSVYGEYLDGMYGEENYLEVTFDADVDPEEALVIIHSADSMNWHVHPLEDVTVNADGTITLKLYDLGVVAFLVEAEEEVDAETAVQSPN